MARSFDSRYYSVDVSCTGSKMARSFDSRYYSVDVSCTGLEWGPTVSM